MNKNKLTSAKRLKELKNNGWLEFVEFMKANKLSPRDLCCSSLDMLHPYKILKMHTWVAEDIGRDLFLNISSGQPKMPGLSEQVYPNYKNNKITKRFNIGKHK